MRRRRLLSALAAAGVAGPASSVLAGLPTPAVRRRNADPSRAPLTHAPAPLRPGSRLVAVAPGTWWESPQQEAERLRRRCAAEGWTLVIPPEATGRWRWFSGPDLSRRSQLERAWADPKLDAVLCVAGGWGSARILEAGWMPGERPLWLVGFSDATALLLAQWAAGHTGAVHASSGGDEAQWQRLVQLLRGESLPPLNGSAWRPGVASGPLVVANLTVATALIGTPWFPTLKGCVLVIEDVGESPYRVDRMLTQWRMAGLLSELAGIGVGHFSWKADDVLPGDLSLEEVLRDRLGDLGIPVVGQLPVGHGRPNLALPLGRIGVIDGDSGQLSLR